MVNYNDYQQAGEIVGQSLFINQKLHLKPRLTVITKTASIFVIAVTSLAISRMLFDLHTLKSLMSGLENMKFNTALCLLFSGIALFVLNQQRTGRFSRIISKAFPFAVLLITLLTLSEYLTGWNIGIDDFFYKHPAATNATINPGRMPAATAAFLLLFNTALLLMPFRKAHFLIHTLLIAGIVFLVLMFLGIVLRVSIDNTTQVVSKIFINSVFVFLLLFIAAFFSYPLSHLQFSFQKKLLGVFGMVCFSLIILFLSFNSSIKRAAESAGWVEHTNQVLLLSEKIQALMGEIQAGVRGYFLTGDEGYLPLFNSGSDSVALAIDRLRSLIKDNPTQQKRIDTLQNIIGGYIEDRQKLVGEIKAKGFFSQPLREAVNEGKEIMDKARRIIIGVQFEEEQLLNKRKEDNKRRQEMTGRSILLFFVVTGLLLLAAFLVIYHNIKARNKAEHALRSSLNEIANFKTLFECAPGLYLILHPDFKIAAVSDEYLKATMTRREAILGRGLFEVFPGNPDDTAADGVSNLQASLNFVLKNKAFHAMANQKYDIAGPDGSFEERIWAPLNKPVLDAKGEVVYIIHSVEDITVRLRNEQELIRKTNEIKDLYNNAPCGYHSLDSDGCFIDINETELKWLGYKRDELIGKLRFTDLLKKESKEIFIQHFTELKKRGIVHDVELDMVRREGTVLPVIISATALYDEQGNYLKSRTTVIDYTERKKLDDQLRQFNRELEKRVEEKTKEVIEKEQQYRFLLQNMREGIQVIGYDWTYLFVNNSVIHQSKYSNEELLGHTMMEKYPGIENTELFKTLHRCMKQRMTAVFENEFTFPDGSKEWFELSIQPVPEGLFVLSMDITERKKAEESVQRYMNELKASNTELERFAYIASHDLQEPVRMVSSFMGLLEEGLDGKLDETNREYLNFAVDGAERMKALIQALLQYSRIGTQTEDFDRVDINEIAGYVTRLLEKEIQINNATLRWNSMPVVTANKILISQLFFNLVNNALKYRSKEDPVIEVGSIEQSLQHVFYVKDNGQGIEPRFFEKIFVIFQRLHNKSEYSGTGIGLAICKKIVEIHHGKIWVESASGKGSTFYFSIPKQPLI